MLPIPRPRLAIGLLKTGQVTSYGSGTGVDDGALQKGIAKAYTVLTAGQYAGTTNIALNGKTDAHSNNCVLDNNTGLMWSRYASASVGPASNGLLPWTTNAGGEGIFSYAAAANAASLGGYADWRVPNISELYSLIDFSLLPPTPNATAFPSCPQAATWASTTDSSPTENAAAARFSGNSAGLWVVCSIVKTSPRQVFLVRGG